VTPPPFGEVPNWAAFPPGRRAGGPGRSPGGPGRSPGGPGRSPGGPGGSGGELPRSVGDPGPAQPAAADARMFADGGLADRIGPCGVLAGLTGEALTAGMDRLSDDELVGVLRAARRVQSWQVAVELACVAELTARRRPQRADGGPRPAERAAAEVAAALTLTGRAADLLVDLAAQADRLTSVAGSLAGGDIDLAKARVFAAELAGLPAPAADAIAARLLPTAAGLTTGQLRSRLRRAVLAFDPEAARQRQQAARGDARVETWPEPSGNASLTGRELPEADVIAADRRLSAIAAWLAGRGVPGTTGQLRAAAYTCLLLGKPVTTLLPDGSDRVDADSPLATSSDPPVTGTINLTLPLATWMGLAAGPGQITGYGPAHADTCRDLATTLTQSPETRYCVTITTPAGQPLGHACTSTPPPSGGLAQATPRPSGTGPPGTGPPGTGPPGGGPPGGGPDPPVAADLAAWLARLHVEWLTTGTCDHLRETPGYRPAAKLTHLIKIRNPSCTAPGCRRPATRSDLDHIIPYQDGGRTCECNLHTPCRRHHRLKGTAGWHAQMTTPGTITWTLPHGRTYTTTAEPYPV
jgi:Domain of unknown function (DUF222)